MSESNSQSQSAAKDDELQQSNTQTPSGVDGDGCDRYLLVDIGANLTNRKYNKDLDSVVARAKESGSLCRR